MRKYVLLLFVSTFFFTSNAQITDVVTGLNNPQRLFLDGNTLYFTDANSIQKIDITEDPASPELVIGGLATPESMALDGTDLYVAEFNASRISKIDLSVSPATREDFVTGIGTPNFLLLDNDFLYYSDNNANVVARFDINASNPTAETVASSNINFNPSGLAIRGNILYMGQGLANRISFVDITTSDTTPTDLVAALGRPLGIRIQNDILFIAEFTGNEISSINLADTSPTISTVVTGVSSPRDIALNATTLFIVDSGTDKIVKVENILDIQEQGTQTITLFPNPANSYISIAGIQERSAYTIFSIEGKEISNGILEPQQQIDISELSAGSYFFKINEKPAILFLKQ